MIAETVLAFGTLFSIVDPFAAVPIFVGLLSNQPQAIQSRAAKKAALTCLVVLSVFGFAGTFIFHFFGITLPAFKLAGAAVLFGVAMDMMRAKGSETRNNAEETAEAETKAEVGVIPLGIPLLSGPGAIASVMVLVARSKTMPARVGVFIAIAAVSLLSFLVLRSSVYFARVLGKTGINLIGRIMGLILAATAAQFLIDGIREGILAVR